MKKLWLMGSIFFIILIAFQWSGGHILAAKKPNPWKAWLSEVDLIMTRMERGVAKVLKTEEQRNRFKELFWKARDPIPQTPENEYRIQFYQRIQYAEKYLNRVTSERGRIYVLLGKPHQKNTFIGHNDLVECELWSYQGEDRPGLLPFMNLIFFRPRNTGDFQLYRPGIHTSRDLLAPHAYERYTSDLQSYRLLKMNSGELADASLSIIPGEGNAYNNTSIGTSNLALNRIYSLPEREAEQGYVRSFKFPGSSVQVTHSTKHIRGYAYIAVTGNKTMNFVHYAMMPEMLHLTQTSKDLFTADIHLHISIETLTGDIIYQHRRTIDFKADAQRKEVVRQRRVVFRDFAPIIEGQYHVAVTFMDQTSGEFFTYEENVNVGTTGVAGPSTPYAVVGYDMKEITTENFLPFATGDLLVLTDPRFTFSRKDVITGYVSTATKPHISLIRKNNKTISIPVDLLPHREGLYKFRFPLTGVPDGTYLFTVKGEAEPELSRTIHVMPFYIDIARPFVMERPQPASAMHNFYFARGQQFVHVNRVQQAIDDYNRIPKHLWNSVSLPIIAKAYYLKGDYKTVLELLEREEVKQEYSTLLMLANASIETKRFNKALEYLQKIRAYGDTTEINQLIAAVYLGLGDRTNAKNYYQRAKKLKQ